MMGIRGFVTCILLLGTALTGTSSVALADTLECEELLLAAAPHNSNDPRGQFLEILTRYELSLSNNHKLLAKRWGQTLSQRAHALLTAKGIKTRSIMLSQKHLALEIIPNKKGSYLERLADGLMTTLDGCRLVYAPGRLIQGNAGAYFLPAENMVLIPHHAIVEHYAGHGTLHELRHARFHQMRAEGKDSIFHGWAVSKSKTEPLVSKTKVHPLYRTGMHFEELSTFVLELVSSAMQLKRSMLPLDNWGNWWLKYGVKNQAELAIALATQTAELMSDALLFSVQSQKVKFSRGRHKVWVQIELDKNRKITMPLFGEELITAYSRLYSVLPARRQQARRTLEDALYSRLQELQKMAFVLERDLTIVSALASDGPKTPTEIDAILKAVRETRFHTIGR